MKFHFQLFWVGILLTLVPTNSAFVLHDASVFLIKEQILALEDSDEADTELNYTLSVGKVENNGSGWVDDQIGSMSVELLEIVTTGGSSYAKLLMNYWSILNNWIKWRKIYVTQQK